ncbi:MAG: hypothetical protein FJ189_10640, partial [Gammaproteobacteria bacterium]|nr:hypothetical protein [Gammaproteobacteria bacterium]
MRLYGLIPRFFGSGLRHDEAVLLLPWYANGTLKSPERRRMHHHVCRCESCRADLASLEDLQHTLRQLPTPVIRQTAFDSLMASIERSEQEQGKVSDSRVRATARPARAHRFGWTSFAWLYPTTIAPVAAAAGL